MSRQITVVIPAKNEEHNIGRVVADIRKHTDNARIVVVDDASSDATAAVAESAGALVVRSPIVLGVGGAVQLGVKFGLTTDSTIFVRMDGDGQHCAEYIMSLVGSSGQNRMVVGTRSELEFQASSTWLRHLGSLYFTWLFRLFTWNSLPDPTSGFICFGRDIAKKFAAYFPMDYPEVESAVLLLRSGVRIEPVLVHMEPRRRGRSSIGLFKSLIYMASVTVAFFVAFVKKNPYER